MPLADFIRTTCPFLLTSTKNSACSGNVGAFGSTTRGVAVAFGAGVAAATGSAISALVSASSTASARISVGGEYGELASTRRASDDDLQVAALGRIGHLLGGFFTPAVTAPR